MTLCFSSVLCTLGTQSFFGDISEFRNFLGSEFRGSRIDSDQSKRSLWSSKAKENLSGTNLPEIQPRGSVNCPATAATSENRMKDLSGVFTPDKTRANAASTRRSGQSDISPYRQ